MGVVTDEQVGERYLLILQRYYYYWFPIQLYYPIMNLITDYSHYYLDQFPIYRDKLPRPRRATTTTG